MMRISLVITTFNRPDALGLVLASGFDQSLPPLEIIVADDGSGPETGNLVRSFAETSSVPVLHSWQQDRGFRAARSRNRAMAMARGDYLVYIDGDMLLERHFIEDHAHWAQPGYFVQGSRTLLDERITRQMISSQKRDFSFLAAGVGNRKNCIRSTFLARLFSRTREDLPGVRTCNFAFWKKDGIAVNGFNEDFVGWGREDSEFAARLLHHGVARRNLRFNAIAYHLYHSEHSRESLPENDRILAATVIQKKTWCENGVNQHQIE